MKKYTLEGLNFRKNAFFLLFLAYSLVASMGMSFHERKEVFPVFSWSLFTYVWENAWGYEVDIVRVDDQVFDPPKNFYELGHIFSFAGARDPGIIKAASDVVSAREHDPDRLDDLRAVIEDRYLAGPSRVDYNIVFVVFEPLERWHTGRLAGKIIEKVEMASYSTGDRK
ncbi:MAG TPA: hypothetical protein VLA52_06250 [Thermohalobaculum sp.]|nr:hypothetical protein [Thermohalobaculum sp.]